MRPDVPAFARSVSTPFVGRREELGELRQAFETIVRESSCRLATIVGPPGIGKSRLARELLRSLESEARVVVGRCAAYGEGITYLPLAEVVSEVAGADPEAGARGSCWRTSNAAPSQRGSSLGAIGANDEAGSPEETAWAFRRLFETLAVSRPLVVVVDDIHWAEPALLDLLEYVLGFSSGAPILLLCLARPDLFDARPSWAAPRPRTTLVSLAPLSDDRVDGSDRRAACTIAAIAPALRDRIVDAAEGNPLFVEQMLAMLADDPDAAVEAVPATHPGTPRGPHRPARAGRAGGAPARIGGGAAVPPRRGRGAAAVAGRGRARRRSSRPDAQGAACGPTGLSTRATTASASTTCSSETSRTHRCRRSSAPTSTRGSPPGSRRTPARS